MDPTPASSRSVSIPSTFRVRAEAFVPVPVASLWPRLAGPGLLPGTVLSRDDDHAVRFVRFRHEGIRGWLPIAAPVGELTLTDAEGGARVALSLTGEATADLVPVVERRLQGWADASLAARLGAVRQG